MIGNIWHLVYRNHCKNVGVGIVSDGRMSSLPEAINAIARAKKAVNSQLPIILLAVVIVKSMEWFRLETVRE